jgi:Ca-activated chloride channel family protein
MPMTTTAPEISAGLRTKTTAIPLEHVDVRASITGAQARVTVTQRYRNQETQPVEAVYVFPLDERAAVCGFSAVVNGVRYDGVVKPREDAFATYDDALAEGHGAFLLDEERPDVFTASVGSLLPGSIVQLELTYVTELMYEGDALRFTLPTTVAPRYAPAEDRVGVGRPDGEALNPPSLTDVPYCLTFQATVTPAALVRRIESPSHPVALEMGGETTTVSLAQQDAALDRDLVLLIGLTDATKPHIVIERGDDGRVAAAVTMRPTSAIELAAADVVFVVDRSGSMGGSSIAQVRNALQLCLRSLVPGSSFNIVGFGSRFEALFDGCRSYDESSLAAASQHVESMDASLGGTEILPPLEFVLNQPRSSERPLQLVILTDGDVTNTDAVINLVRRHADRARVFTFGIGRAASQHLLTGLARAGRGAAEFIHPGERLEAKIVRQFARILSPALTDIRLEWDGVRATAATEVLPPVFANEPVRAYAWIDQLAAGTVTLRATGSTGPLAWSLDIDPRAVTTGRAVGTLAARARIRELEEGGQWTPSRGSRQRDRQVTRAVSAIVQLATQYGLASRETSWIVVEHRDVVSSEPAVLRRVPIAIASGWGGKDQVDPMSAPLLGNARSFHDCAFESSPAMTYKLDHDPRVSRSRSFTRVLGGWFSQRRAPVSDSPLVPPAAPLPRGSERPLDRVIALQRADGSWELDATLLVACGLAPERLPALEALVPPDALVEGRRAMATAIALTFLMRRAAHDRTEWALLAQKADRYLASVRVQPSGGGTWLDAAMAFDSAHTA